MTNFGLLDSVQSILNNNPQLKDKYSTVNPSNVRGRYIDLTVNTDLEAVNPVPDIEPAKSVHSIYTLGYGDCIVDSKGNKRYIISVDTGSKRILMTGRKRDLSNYGKAFIWSFDKFRMAVRDRGFRLR